MFRLGLLLVTAVVVAGCASGDETLDTVDPAAVFASPTYEQVFAIIDRKCLMCHDNGDDDDGDDSGGGYYTTQLEDAVDLSTCTAIVAQGVYILEQVFANTMPPGALPRLTSEEKLIIQRWVDNGAQSPCTP